MEEGLMFMREFVNQSRADIQRLTNNNSNSNKDYYQAIYLEGQLTLAEIDDILTQKINTNLLSNLIHFLKDRWDRIKNTDANYCHNYYGLANQVCMALAKNITDLIGGDPNHLLMPTLEIDYPYSLRGAVMSDDNKTCIDVFNCLDQMKKNGNRLVHTHPVQNNDELSEAEKLRVINFSARSKRYYEDLLYAPLKAQYKSRNNLQKQITTPNRACAASYNDAGWERLEQNLYYLWDDYENLIHHLPEEAKNEWLDFMSNYRDSLALEAGFYDDEEEYRRQIENIFADEEREEMLASEPIEEEDTNERFDNFPSQRETWLAEDYYYKAKENTAPENPKNNVWSQAGMARKYNSSDEEDEQENFFFSEENSSSSDESSAEEPGNESDFSLSEHSVGSDTEAESFDDMPSFTKKKYSGNSKKEKEETLQMAANDKFLEAAGAVRLQSGVQGQHSLLYAPSYFSINRFNRQDTSIDMKVDVDSDMALYNLSDLFKNDESDNEAVSARNDYASGSDDKEENNSESDYSSSSESGEESSSESDYSSSSDSDEESSESDYSSSSESEEESSESDYSSSSESDEESSESDYSSSSESDEESSESDYSSSSEIEESSAYESIKIDDLFLQRLHALKKQRENDYWINSDIEEEQIYSLKSLFKSNESSDEEEENTSVIYSSSTDTAVSEALEESSNDVQLFSKAKKSIEESQSSEIFYSDTEQVEQDGEFSDDEENLAFQQSYGSDASSSSGSDEEDRSLTDSDYLSGDSAEDDFFDMDDELKMEENTTLKSQSVSSSHAPSLSFFAPVVRQFDAKTLTNNKFILKLMNCDRSQWLNLLQNAPVEELKKVMLQGRTVSAACSDSSIYTGNEVHDRAALVLFVYLYRLDLINRDSKFNVKSSIGSWVSWATRYDTAAITGYDKDTKLLASLKLLDFLLSDESLLNAEAHLTSLCDFKFYGALTQTNSDLGTLTRQTIARSKELSQFEPARQVKLNLSVKNVG